MHPSQHNSGIDCHYILATVMEAVVIAQIEWDTVTAWGERAASHAKRGSCSWTMLRCRHAMDIAQYPN